ncbi:hypothetical protein ACX801_17960 [Arthrobacter bambusae]
MAQETSATGWNSEPFNADEDAEAPDLWKDPVDPEEEQPAFLAPDIEAELEAEGPPDWLGLRWKDIADEDRADAWTGLRQWVDWFIREYNLNTSQITPCWYEHADITAELYAAMCAEYKIWEEGLPGIGAMTTWHPHVQALKSRLSDMMSKRQCVATNKHHADTEDLPFTYDQERWSAVRDGVTTITELPRHDTNRWWRPVANPKGAEPVTGKEILVGGTRKPAPVEITGTTLFSGAAAGTFQARHATSPGAGSEAYWEHAPATDPTVWTRHTDKPEEPSATVTRMSHTS